MTTEEQAGLRALQDVARATLMDDHQMSEADREAWQAERRRWRLDAVSRHLAASVRPG